MHKTKLFSFSGDITRGTATEAVQWLVDNAEEIARRKAMVAYHEDHLRVVKSTAMELSNAKSVAAKEVEAYQSTQYIAAVEKKRDAVFAYERLLNSKLEASLRRVV
jgi:hypothetical protein